MNIILITIFFFVFLIKFRKAKQKVVALIATAFKALLAVAKTNGRLSWRKFYAGNIYYLSWYIIIVHIFPPQHTKKVRPMKERTEKVFLHCCHTISFQR